jgi:hypothetical protein
MCHRQGAAVAEGCAQQSNASATSFFAVSAIDALSARQMCVHGRKRAQCRNCSTLSFAAFSSICLTTCARAQACVRSPQGTTAAMLGLDILNERWYQLKTPDA